MIEKDKIIQELKLETKINDLEKQLKSIMSSVYYQTSPAKTDKLLFLATFSFIFKHLSWFEDEYILKASFTTSSNSLLYFSIT